MSKKVLLALGAVAIAALGVIGALNYSSKTTAESTQGAIGQRSVHRDNGTSSADVAVTPGAAPVADGANAAPLTPGSPSPAVNSQAVSSDARQTSDFRGRQSDARPGQDFRGRQSDARPGQDFRGRQSDARPGQDFRGRQSDARQTSDFRGRQSDARQSDARASQQ